MPRPVAPVEAFKRLEVHVGYVNRHTGGVADRGGQGEQHAQSAKTCRPYEYDSGAPLAEHQLFLRPPAKPLAARRPKVPPPTSHTFALLDLISYILSYRTPLTRGTYQL